MPKGGIAGADYIVTEASKLRDQLSRAEMLAFRLRARDGRSVLRLLKMRDALEIEFAEREEAGQDMRSERSRLETIDNVLHSRGAIIVRALGSAGGIEHYREEINAPESHWWWFVDREVRAHRRRSIIKTARITIIALVLVFGGNWVLDRLYGLSPLEKEARNYTSAGEDFLMNGEYDQAIEQYELARDVMPDLPDVQAALGALYDGAGRHSEAEEAFAKARALVPNEFVYELSVAQAYQRAGQTETALVRVEKAIALDGSNPEGIYIRGSIHEELGDTEAAVADYELASELAIDQNQDALYVMAKTRLGMLLQGGGGFGGAFGF